MSIRSILAQKALNTVRDKVLNPKLGEIAKINSMEWREGKLYLTLALNGLEDRDIHVICNRISISEDGSEITLSDFESDMPFVENALNAFASGSHKLPDGSMARMGLAMARKILNL